jgi:hypothetical protein
MICWYVTGYEWLNYKQECPMKVRKEGASAEDNGTLMVIKSECNCSPYYSHG